MSLADTLESEADGIRAALDHPTGLSLLAQRLGSAEAALRKAAAELRKPPAIDSRELYNAFVRVGAFEEREANRKADDVASRRMHGQRAGAARVLASALDGLSTLSPGSTLDEMAACLAHAIERDVVQ